MTAAKLASTTMLCRDHNGSLEVLLLKRNSSLAFAAGLWVFPGGKVDNHELEVSSNELEAAKVATVREVKEEANIDIIANQLIFFRHWTTPLAEPRRYAAYFFFVGADSHNSKVTIDDSEIKDHLWINPQEALDRLASGELAMMPPTMMSLQLIRKCKSVSAARYFLQNSPVVHTLPVIHMKGKNITCIYEGDKAYESGNVALEGARHRLTMNLSTNHFDFEFCDCAPEVLPVNGGMHI